MSMVNVPELTIFTVCTWAESVWVRSRRKRDAEFLMVVVVYMVVNFDVVLVIRFILFMLLHPPYLQDSGRVGFRFF
jgi:hypothetical protein